MFRTRCQLEMLAGSPLQLCSARRRRVVWGEVFVGCLQYSLLQLCSVHCLCIAHWRRRQYVQVSFFHLIREDCMCIVGPGCQDNFAQREKTVGFAIKLPTRITSVLSHSKETSFGCGCTWASFTGEAVGPAGSRDLSDFWGEELLSGRVLGVYTLGEECGGHSPVAAAGEWGAPCSLSSSPSSSSWNKWHFCDRRFQGKVLTAVFPRLFVCLFDNFHFLGKIDAKDYCHGFRKV